MGACVEHGCPCCVGLYVCAYAYIFSFRDHRALKPGSALQLGSNVESHRNRNFTYISS